jgi:hypothetical protein
VIEKAMRLRSMVEADRYPAHESIRDTLVDLINYAAFMVEYLDGEVVDE